MCYSAGMRITWLLLAASLLLPSLASAAKPTLPTLTEKQQTKVEAGKLVLLSEDTENGTAMVTGLMEIEADAAEIWHIVLDEGHIIASSGATKECKTYKDETGSDGLRDLRMAFMLKVGFSEIRFHSHRTVNQPDGWMTWQLDPGMGNDIKATVGSYSLWPASTPGKVLFLYKARIETGKKVPEWLEEELTESSLKKFLMYVKDVAESA
ncbi:MAG: hypothetical protein GY898_11160 [Proteobacteria bacterium]|nr:hypothetical protein [Pseudomonadota bacterium]